MMPTMSSRKALKLSIQCILDRDEPVIDEFWTILFCKIRHHEEAIGNSRSLGSHMEREQRWHFSAAWRSKVSHVHIAVEAIHTIDNDMQP
jgi:hypothetical protein